MYVGVILTTRFLLPTTCGIPHVCGGDPISYIVKHVRAVYSPCMWGWSYLRPLGLSNAIVFPMYVGVIHSPFGVIFPEVSIPHVCGGDPVLGQAVSFNTLVFPMYVGVILQLRLRYRVVILYSPCMWGWSLQSFILGGTIWVFPMYVGVILTKRLS